MGPTQAPLGEEVDARFRTTQALKTIDNLIKNTENWAWGYPLGGQKLELAAKMAQDASKSDF